MLITQEWVILKLRDVNNDYITDIIRRTKLPVTLKFISSSS